MFLVDANVLLYAANAECQEHAPCFALVNEWRSQPLAWFSTWPIFYEFLRVVTHPRALPRPWPMAAAWKFVDALLTSPGFSALVETDRHAAVAAQTLSEMPALRGSSMHDAHTAILMREHGVRRIYTRDLGFHRFPFLEVIDPLAPDSATGRGDLDVHERARPYGSRARGGRSRAGSRRPPVRR